MTSHFHWLVPAPEPTPEVLLVYDLTRQFQREVEYREEFDRYCQWYRTTAEQHRQEWQKLQTDWNLLGWFSRRSKRAASPHADI